MQDYMDKEYTCLGMAASSYKDSRINLKSPHGRLVRRPAKDLPGLHSSDRTFVSVETEALFCQLYSGDCVIRWSHSFVLPDSISQEIDRAALERAAPYILIKAFPGTVADNHDPFVVLQPGGGKTSFGCHLPAMPALTESQLNSLAIRILHYFFRVVGCDVGFACLLVMEALTVNYIRKAWWKENLDVAIIMADSSVQIGASVEWLCSNASTLCDALSACKKFRQEAEMYEQMQTDYAVKLPHLEMSISWIFKQAKAYFLNGDYDEAEATVLRGFRELFSAHGEAGGLAEAEFA